MTRSSKRPALSDRRKPKRPRKTASSAHDQVTLYGLHAVRAALENEQRKPIALHVTSSAAERLGEAIQIARNRGARIEERESRELATMVGADAVHQGAVLVAHPLDTLDASELFHLADARLIVVLDQVTDPHNVGAILRSAVAFAADAVIVTSRNAAPETGVLAKSASGALDMIPVITVRNLSGALTELNAMRFATVGLDSDGKTDLRETLAEPLDRVALVLGAEGKGLREQTRQTCSLLARLDMPGAIRSLNVSNAAVLALHLAREALSPRASGIRVSRRSQDR